MKKLLGFFIVVLLIAACSVEKDEVFEKPAGPWDGYFNLLKDGDSVRTLWAGQHIDVGTVTYSIEINGSGDSVFSICYECTGGWELSETHVFAGALIDMPRNKPGKPKIGKFPYCNDHNPWVSTYTYEIPLNTLPPYNIGFSVAAHAVVQNTSGGNETGWAYGANVFSDKGWGWYDDYTFDAVTPDDFTILYGVEYGNDSLYLWIIDATNGGSESELILSEYVGNSSGSYDGTAFDPVTENFFFVNYQTGELYMNDLNSDNASVLIGVLPGIVKSADFYDNQYYYVDENDNTIHVVTFDSNWNIIDNEILSTIPSSVVVTDIAIAPDGSTMYIVGNVDGGGTEMITWDIEGDAYSTISLTLEDGTQIAYGEDGILYAIEPLTDGSGAEINQVDTDTGVSNPISENPIIIIDDPFSDIAKGPIM